MKTNEQMSTITLDKEIWRKLKIIAINENKRIKEVIAEAIIQYIKQKEKK